VLRPQQREDLELEVVGLPLEERDDAGELPVREAEPAMKRLFRDEAQAASLDGRSEIRRTGWRARHGAGRHANFRSSIQRWPGRTSLLLPPERVTRD
jgi:hypothetical protein